MTREWCVIFNPAAGRRRAESRLNRWRERLADRADFRPTERAGHARELAQEAASSGYSVVGAAGGDGTVHEVLNGLMAAQRRDVRLGLLPIGSANDFAFSLQGGPAPVPTVRTIDVGLIQSPGTGRKAWFGCCAGIGFNAFVTLESRQIHHLQGIALYGWATLRALIRHFRHPWMDITFDQEPPWRTPTFLFSILNGRREGSFPMALQSQIDDGLFHFVHAGAVSRWQVLKLLPRLAISGPPPIVPHVRQGVCRQVRVLADEPLMIHIDGEFFCQPVDGLREVEVTICPSALQVDLEFAKTP